MRFVFVDSLSEGLLEVDDLGGMDDFRSSLEVGLRSCMNIFTLIFLEGSGLHRRVLGFHALAMTRFLQSSSILSYIRTTLSGWLPVLPGKSGLHEEHQNLSLLGNRTSERNYVQILRA